MDVRSLINDARVLLSQLQSGRWSELHVRTPQGEIFISRHGGGPNPMRRVATGAIPGAAETGDSEAVAASLEVRAPHVGTVLDTLSAQTRVAANDVVIRLALLGEVIEVLSPHAGVISKVPVASGALVEYESPLFTLVRSQ